MPPFYFLTFAKVSVSVSKKFGLKKVSVSVSKPCGLEKKSQYWSQKYLVSKRNLGIGLGWIFWSPHSVGLNINHLKLLKIQVSTWVVLVVKLGLPKLSWCLVCWWLTFTGIAPFLFAAHFWTQVAITSNSIDGRILGSGQEQVQSS